MIKVAVVGIGNCFAGLWQGIEFYRKNPQKQIIGIMHETIGSYKVTDIEFVVGFDVSELKINKPLHEAIYQKPNMVDWVKITESKAIVHPGPVLDGVGKWVTEDFKPHAIQKTDAEWKSFVLQKIKESGAEVLINFLPVGSEKATRFWAEICLEAGLAFVNCMPAFILSDPEWAKRFKEKNIPAIGDDVKAQIGATIVNRVLAKLTADRGTELLNQYQLNFGGNTDFKNMLERERLISKKISKTESVQSQLKKPLPADNIHIGPSDFVPYLKNTKICYMNFNGLMWADVPFSIELKLQVDDKANSSAVVADAIRIVKLAKDKGIGGPLLDASAYLMKHPPIQMSDSEAKQKLDEFIRSNS